jgi:hypothetical protein
MKVLKRVFWLAGLRNNTVRREVETFKLKQGMQEQRDKCHTYQRINPNSNLHLKYSWHANRLILASTISYFIPCTQLPVQTNVSQIPHLTVKAKTEHQITGNRIVRRRQTLVKAMYYVPEEKKTPWPESASELLPTERPPLIVEVIANFCGWRSVA